MGTNKFIQFGYHCSVHRLYRGRDRACRQFFKSMAGQPSGPAAELYDISPITSMRSFSQNIILVTVSFCISSLLKSSSALLLGCLGVLNYLEYCCERISATFCGQATRALQHQSADQLLFVFCRIAFNYRTVSVLPVFSKVLERLMNNRLITCINQNHLLCNLQFGFQKGKFTHLALITHIDKISEALDNGDFVIGVFLDFCKELDTVDHSILKKTSCLWN